MHCPDDRPLVGLIVIDEVERLSDQSIELLRDRYDRHGMALVLIGMTGLEKQFSLRISAN